MDLKDFVKRALVEIDSAVSEASEATHRRIYFGRIDGRQTVEFDIAVMAEAKTDAKGKAGVRVLQFVEGGGEFSKEMKDAKVSRISFGVTINQQTKSQEAQDEKDRNKRVEEQKNELKRRQPPRSRG